MRDNLYQIADELRAIASLGMRYADGGYDRERYEQILKLSARLVAAVEEGTFEDVYAQYRGSLAHLSPIFCVEAAVFRQGKILLIQRRDDRLWAQPGGLAEVGEAPAPAVERELWEEAGVRGKVSRLLGIYDSRLWPSRTRLQLYLAQFLVESDDEPFLHPVAEGENSPHAETLDVGFFAEDALPGLSHGHDLRVPMAFKLYRGEIEAPYFDR
jgi:8-oxo-dGTP pyrophosphatase MutT (NUDIX family)